MWIAKNEKRYYNEEIKQYNEEREGKICLKIKSKKGYLKKWDLKEGII